MQQNRKWVTCCVQYVFLSGEHTGENSLPSNSWTAEVFKNCQCAVASQARNGNMETALLTL